VSAVLAATRLHARDLLAVSGVGLRTRRLRAALSALGITIGIAAMVAVLGISTSSRAQLMRQLDALGTNLLQITPGETFGGDTATLPKASTAMIGRVAPVQRVAAVGTVDDASVRRSDKIPGHRDRRPVRQAGRPRAARHPRRQPRPGPLAQRRHGQVPGGGPGRERRRGARHRPRRRPGSDQRAVAG
jgi:hypothetical protein